MWYCSTRLMRSSGDKYNSTFGKALRAISLACSPGTILYTSRSNILSRLQTPTTLLHIIIRPQRYKQTHTIIMKFHTWCLTADGSCVVERRISGRTDLCPSTWRCRTDKLYKKKIRYHQYIINIILQTTRGIIIIKTVH